MVFNLNYSSMNEKNKDFFESTGWTKNKTIVAVIIIICATAVALLTSCNAKQFVSQSASTFKNGDTVVTKITYEQIGTIKK